MTVREMQRTVQKCKVMALEDRNLKARCPQQTPLRPRTHGSSIPPDLAAPPSGFGGLPEARRPSRLPRTCLNDSFGSDAFLLPGDRARPTSKSLSRGASV